MASADPQHAQRTETLALVRSLEQADGALDADWAQAALERLGDMIRLGDTTPPALLRMLSECEPRLLIDAIALSRAEVITWPLPVNREAARKLDGFPFTLRRRDELHSFIVGLTRLALSHEHGLDRFEGYLALAQAAADFDRALAAVCSRQNAEDLLDARITLQAASTWLHVLADEEVVISEESGPVPDVPAMRPSASEVEAYASAGELRSYVEAFALRDMEFGAELCAAIDTLRELGEPVCLVARGFRKKLSPRTESGPDYQFALDKRLAAASEDHSDQQQNVQLGPLPEIAGHASLALRGDGLELSVYTEGVLELVQLGDAKVHAPLESQGTVMIWRVRTPLPAGMHRVRAIVRDSAGREVDEEFTVEIS